MTSDRTPTPTPAQAEYARTASNYDKRWSAYMDASIRETMSRLSVRPGDRILDVGCGTGRLLETIASTHPQARLAGIDPSPEMLAIARRRLPPSVELAVSWSEQLPFLDESFDAVVSSSVLHCIRRPHAVFGEMTRVLRPGGMLVVTDWRGDSLMCQLRHWPLRMLGGAYVRAYRESELRRFFAESGYSSVEIKRYHAEWLWQLMTASAVKPDLSPI